MTAPTAVNYEVLTTAVRDTVIPTYQYKSLLGLFPSVPIKGGIAAEKWAQKYLHETKRAAVHRRGYNPNKISLDYDGFEITPVTVDQEITLTETDIAQYQEVGLWDKKVPMIGENMAYTTNTWIMMHKGGNQENAPFTEHHYIIADGDGSNGTADQPLWLYDAATAGAWSTIANLFSDLAKIKGNFIANGGNIDSTIMLIPRCAAPAIEKVRSEYQNKTAGDYIREIMKIPYLYVEDEFFYTAAGSLPTLTAFDIILLDVNQFVVGYQRPERVRVIPPHYDIRSAKVEAEVWFAFLCVPFRRNESGTIKTYKNTARVTAINGS